MHEASKIVFLPAPFLGNLGERIVKTPELYCLDTGLCSHHLGAWTPDDLLHSPTLCALFKTHVPGQILGHFANLGRRREIHFFRDHPGLKVDFLIPSAERGAVIEGTWVGSLGATQRGLASSRRWWVPIASSRRRSSPRLAAPGEPPRRC